MVATRQLKHYYYRNTALSYNSNDTPLNGPHWESGSKNVLTNIQQYAQRAPGFTPVEPTPTTFTGKIVRLFTWEMWDGTFYIIANEVIAATSSSVYKLKIGTDTSFGTALYTDTVGKTAFDFCISNNTLYFSNGTIEWAWNGGSAAVRPWGIETSGMIGGSGDLAKGMPTVNVSAGTGVTATVGYKYVYTYYNPTTNHQSSASNPSQSTGIFSNKGPVITLCKTVDAQVTKVKVYRTTDGGGGIYFEINGSPFTHTPGTGTMTVTDTTPDDASLSSMKAPVGPDLSQTSSPTPHGMNDPPLFYASPQTASQPIWYANRIWMFRNNTLIYTAWEEIATANGDLGLEEECFPPTNYFVFPQKITALASNDDMLLVFTASNVWKITGDTQATFRRDPLFKKMGTRSQTCVAEYGRSIAWFDRSHTIRITDGYQQKELSIDIRPDIASISFTTASLSFYSDGTANWLCLLDGTGGKMFVYDLDLQQWMPPWEHVGASRSMYWGEISAGTPALLIGSATNRVLKMTPAAWTFDSASYTAVLKSNLNELTPPDQPARIATPQLITLERNSVALSDVLELRDENTDSGTYTSDFANIATVGTISPPLRPTGSAIVEEWFTTQMTACKRLSVQFQWGGASTNFILYSFSIGFYEVT